MAVRTPTETVMKVLEDFSDDEAIEVFIITKHKSGDVSWSSSTDELSTKLGLLEFVKTCIVHNIFKSL